MTDTKTKKFNPEVTFRASEKHEGQFYTYVNEYTLKALQELVDAATEIFKSGKEQPLNFTILSEDDRNFYTEKRKFKFAPDARLQYWLPKDSAQDF